MKPLLLTRGIPSQERTRSEPSWWAAKVTGLEGTGEGGGAESTRSTWVLGLSDHVTQLRHFSSTLTQLLHVPLPALQQLHRLRGAAVQGKMVSHTWQELSCNKGKISVLGVVDRCKAEHLRYFFFFFLN